MMPEDSIKFQHHDMGNSLNKHQCINNKKDIIEEISHKSDIYNQLLINDPFYLRFVRKYEKKLGLTTPISWFNAFYIIFLHLWTFCSAVCLLGSIKWQTVICSFVTLHLAGFGVTGGVHRYWTHRTYKANLPLQIILAICFSMAGQSTIYNWVRDHRVHHKCSETSADPHNANRGFFFSHIGWLMMKKHPDVIREGKKIDMSDVADDPIVKFHTKYYIIMNLLFCWILPSLVPIFLWNEHWAIAIISQSFLRYLCNLHITWSVNSAAHLWGYKPYNRHIMPAENATVSLFSLGEGWHNYHHTFPWDYKASELGTYLNTTTVVLNCFARISWAYDLKEASPALIKNTVKNRANNSNY